MAFGFIGEKFTSLLAKDRISVRRGASSGEIEYADFVTAVDGAFAPIDSPTLTGDVQVPVPSEAGQPLRWESDAKITNAEIVAVKVTSNVNIENVSPRLFINETDQAANAKNWRISPFNGVLQFGPSDDAGTHQQTPIQINRATNQVDMASATSVTVPAATAATHAAQVSAIDAATGKLAIGGREIGDTGWRDITSWTSAGVVTGVALGAGWEPRPGQAGYVRLRRTGNSVFWNVSQIQTNTASPAGAILTLPTGFRAQGVGLSVSAVSAGSGIFQRSSVTVTASAASSGAIFYGMEWSHATPDSWPTSLPGTAV